MLENAKINGSHGKGILNLYTHQHTGQRLASRFVFNNRSDAIKADIHDGLVTYEGFAFTDNEKSAQKVKASVFINPIDDLDLQYDITFNDQHLQFLD